VERSANRKLSEISTEELEAAAQEARAEIGSVTQDEQALVQDVMSKAVH
jgi:hypothetical protein